MRPAVAIGVLGLVTLAGGIWAVMDMKRIRTAAADMPPGGERSIAVTTQTSSGEPRTVRVEQTGQKEAAAAAARIAEFEARWSDAISLAESTARIQLATPVKDLQALAREATTLELTTCLEPGRESLTRSLDAQVSFFLAFMAQETWKHPDLLSLAAREGRNWQMIKDACRFG